ncbi:MAG TPA: DUF4202 domain-containing protein [Polyangiaceae bacterium]|nr:DUF4202 domain-containing protein [Polyangiaceae bacterium]
MSSARFAAAIAAFDRKNSEDPNREVDGGVEYPREWLDAQRLSVWVERLEPNASEALQLAARCQHLQRWRIPRSAFPEGRVGYLQWRTQLGRFHADEAEKVLHESGYAEDVIGAVRRINLKQNLHSNHDTRIMEDALCLSFMEHELERFATQHSDEKLVNILKKTWSKMSERARVVAAGLSLSARLQTLLERALTA